MFDYILALWVYATQILDSTLIKVTGTAIVSAITGFALFFKERRAWKNATFESRINVSLNTVHDGILRIRTLIEKDVKDVILSPYARRIVKKTAQATTLDDEFLQFDDMRDAWMVYTEIVNAISSIYAAQTLAMELGWTYAVEKKLLIALTWERDAEVQIQKLRVIVVREDALREMARDFSVIRLERHEHRSRVDTLEKMHKQLTRGEWPMYQTVLLPQA